MRAKPVKYVTMKTLLGITLGLTAAFIVGCGDNLTSTARFRLPQGNAEYGKAAFVALNCTACHTVTGVPDLPKPTAASENVIALGGEVARLRSVGDLLTAIVHPAFEVSDKMKKSPDAAPAKTSMREVNDRMTVRQMIDLVTFLQPHYTQLPPPVDLYFTL